MSLVFLFYTPFSINKRGEKSSHELKLVHHRMQSVKMHSASIKPLCVYTGCVRVRKTAPASPGGCVSLFQSSQQVSTKAAANSNTIQLQQAVQ